MQNENEELLSRAVEHLTKGMECLIETGMSWRDVMERIQGLADSMKGEWTERPTLLESLPDMEDLFDES